MSSILLLYASQTGNSKVIAERLLEESGTHGLKCDLYCTDQIWKKVELTNYKIIIIVTSSTGDGDPPDNAAFFFRKLKRKTVVPNLLEGIQYALLGLGDTNYSKFCNFPKILDARFSELGAKRFYPCGWADDATSLEIVVEPWIEGLWGALKGAVLSCQVEFTVDKLQDTSITNGTNHSPVSSVECVPADVTSTSLAKADIDRVTSSETRGPTESKTPSVLQPAHEILSTSKPKSDDEPNIRFSPNLSSVTLSLPPCPPAFLQISYTDSQMDVSCLAHQNNAALPSSASVITSVPVTDCQKLTTDNAVKTTLKIQLNTQGCDWQYEPGDAIGVICENSGQDVAELLDRLGISRLTDVGYKLCVLPGTAKRNASIPPYVPESATLRHLFLTCLDFREVPRKPLLRLLVEYTSDEKEKRRLQELCSRQGAQEYIQLLRVPRISVLSLLRVFPTCKPPVERLIELLPRLTPRPYSAASSVLDTPNRLEIVFNLVEFPASDVRPEETGVCTGWMNRITANLRAAGEATPVPTIPIFYRSNQRFRLPDDVKKPVIMIGPGTGVAPFIGFIRHRRAQRLLATLSDFGPMWLIYGCRHKDRDLLFRDELETLQTAGVLTYLHVAFSRDAEERSATSESTLADQEPSRPRYVQHLIDIHQKQLVTWLSRDLANLYVCGDARGMAPAVCKALVQSYSDVLGISTEAAEEEIKLLRREGRYLEDVWT